MGKRTDLLLVLLCDFVLLFAASWINQGESFCALRESSSSASCALQVILVNYETNRKTEIQNYLPSL